MKTVALCVLLGLATSQIQAQEVIDHPHEAVCRVCAARSTHGTDPEPEKVAGVSSYDGKHYYFCSKECQAEFDASPGWWAPLELPHQVPGLFVRNLDGEVVELEVGGGKLTILDFWATWCQPCRKTMRQLQQRYEQASDDVRIVGISTDEGKDAMRKVRRAVRSQGITYPIVLDDQEFPVWTALKVYAVPTIMLVDRKDTWSGASQDPAATSVSTSS